MSRQPGDTVGLGVALLLIEFVVGIRAPTLVADLLDFVFAAILNDDQRPK